MSYLEASKALYESQLRRHYGPARGCWPWTILLLERRLGHRLPEAYREFLRWTGAHHRGPFYGSDWEPSRLRKNDPWLPELLAENRVAFSLPSSFLVFFRHQGYILAWFSLPAESEDPPVWMFHEAHLQQPEQRFTFSHWLLGFMHDRVRVAERLYGKAGKPDPRCHRTT